jgi:nucleotide-binding universal stress UspA family protein
MIYASFPLGIVATTLLFMVCFAALGAGNGALFQLVPLRWPVTTAVAGSMIGEIGALGGGLIPNAMGISKQYAGTFMWGFVVFMGLAVVALAVLRVAQMRWTKLWVDKGGRAKIKSIPLPLKEVETAPAVSAEKRIYNRILYPVGGNSELADLATRHTAMLAAATGASVILVHVEDRTLGLGALTSESAQWQKVKEGWLDEARRILDAEENRIRSFYSGPVEKIVRVGFVAEEVGALADETKADLIVLASQKRSPFGKLLMGSHTFAIFTKVRCPILRIVR